ncbi:MAG: hypothetical protein QNJ97_08300 [Myxococcota bacterium]|nr:hypothetical protein [Myxococcota bacterium]
MFSISSNPVINLATRKWLGRLARQGEILDPPSWDIIQRMIDRCHQVHPGGVIHDLALELGAAQEPATIAGSSAHVFYAVCSVTDDLQDGDTDDYLADVPMSLRINAQSHLLCLMADRLAELTESLGTADSSVLIAAVYRTGATMLTGQRLEIVRDPWTMEAYEQVARQSAGAQFRAYFCLAAMAAQVPQNPWDLFGQAFGALLQVVVDIESKDERLLALSKNARAALHKKFALELTEVAQEVGAAGAAIAAALLRRGSQCRG